MGRRMYVYRTFVEGGRELYGIVVHVAKRRKTRQAIGCAPAEWTLPFVVGHTSVSQKSSSSGASMDSFQGKRFPAFLAKPKDESECFNVAFAQFRFGLGSGETKEEALQDAEYILALGLHVMADRGLQVPEPLEMEKAIALSQGRLMEFGLKNEDVEWITVEVKPEAIKDENFD